MSAPIPIDAEEAGVNEHIHHVDKGLKLAISAMNNLVPYFVSGRPMPVSVYRRNMQDIVEASKVMGSHAQSILDVIEKDGS